MSLKDLLQERFHPRTRQEYINAIKRLIQELTLAGLARAKFYEHGAFYGGTALRIFHGLPRFSEDLDFTLLKAKEQFSLQPYFQAVKTELGAWGLEIEITINQKQPDTQIESAFIKANTRLHLLQVGVPANLVQTVDSELIKVKFEVDTNPPHSFETEVKYLLSPVTCNVKTVSLEQMFAGKVHAVLCRKWKNRVKGRDWYDLVWFIGKNTSCPLSCLESRMRQSGHWDVAQNLDEKTVKDMLKTTLHRMNLEEVKQEAALFIDNQAETEVWSEDFFEHCFDQIIWT